MDSKLVVEQMSGRWQVKHPAMKPLAREAAALVQRLPQVRFSWIPRAQNAHADRLANEAMDAAAQGRVAARRRHRAGRRGRRVAGRARADARRRPTRAPANRLVGWQDPAAPPTTTLLLRHGQTALSVEKRFSGVGDPELTEVGRAQAEAAAARLAGCGAIAVVTARCAGRGRPPSSPPTRSASSWSTSPACARPTSATGRATPSPRCASAGPPSSTRGWPAPPSPRRTARASTRPPRACGRRATGCCRATAAQTVLLVSHVTPIKTLLRLALDAPPSALYRMHLDLASLSRCSGSPTGRPSCGR